MKGLERGSNEDRLIWMNKIEAALFISGRWLSLQELIMLTDLNPLLIKEVMGQLKERYGEKGAIEILNKENKWKMDVKDKYSEMVKRLATGNSEFSRAEQETLAVIAYKQPVSSQ